MAINVNFNGATLFQPGVYSKVVPATGSLSFPSTGRVAIIGEAAKGASGSETGVLAFSSSDLGTLSSYFGSGEIVEAAKALVNPSNDSRIKQGASVIFVYKTNLSTKASLALSTFGSLKSLNYGQEENLISVLLSKVEANLDSKVGVAADVAGTDLTGFKFSIKEKGGAINTFESPASLDTKLELDAALANAANWSLGLPTMISFSTSGADNLVVLTINQLPDVLDNALGYSRVVELISGVGSDLLAFLGISEGLMFPSQEPKLSSLVVKQKDSISENSDDLGGDIGGDIYLEIGCSDVSCVLEINATKLITTASVSEDLDILLSDFNSIEALADFINSKPGYSASVPAGVNSSFSPSILDRVSSLGISSSLLKPGKIKADAYSLYRFYQNNSQLVELVRDSYIGLPDAMDKSFLSGGSRGASASSDFVQALIELEKEDLDFIIPLVSQDASDDLIEDSSSTSVSSTYDVDAILSAVNSHCRKMSGTKARKERQAYFGYRGTKEEVKAKSLSLNSEFCSLTPFDCLILGVWKKPHIAACLAGGMHAGAEVGQGITRKYINCEGIKHVKKQGLKPSLLEAMDSKVNADEMIQNGIMPLLQPSNGGVRCIVHNSTYSKDSNAVFNRPATLYAGNFVARTLRSQLEEIFIGEKNKTSTPADILSFIAAIMADLKRADIIVGDDTNKGLGYKNLSIKVQGNTIYVNIVVTLVESVDFILPTITLDRVQVSL